MTAKLPNNQIFRKPQHLAFDTLDDRREIVSLLDRLPPAKRIAFAKWCCLRSALPKGEMRPQVMQSTIELAERARWDSSCSEMLTQEIYRDLWYLSVQFRFNLASAITMLTQMVRGR